MLDMAFVEEIIPVLIAESSRPTVKGITLAVISQLGLRGRAAVAAEHRIRPLVFEAIRDTFGEDDYDDESDVDEDYLEGDDEFEGYSDFEDDDDDDFGFEDDEEENDSYFIDEDEDFEDDAEDDDEDFDDMDSYPDDDFEDED